MSHSDWETPRTFPNIPPSITTHAEAGLLGDRILSGAKSGLFPRQPSLPDAHAIPPDLIRTRIH